jgi:hypothetical protein
VVAASAVGGAGGWGDDKGQGQKGRAEDILLFFHHSYVNQEYHIKNYRNLQNFQNFGVSEFRSIPDFGRNPKPTPKSPPTAFRVIFEGGPSATHLTAAATTEVGHLYLGSQPKYDPRTKKDAPKCGDGTTQAESKYGPITEKYVPKYGSIAYKTYQSTKKCIKYENYYNPDHTY